MGVRIIYIKTVENNNICNIKQNNMIILKNGHNIMINIKTNILDGMNTQFMINWLLNYLIPNVVYIHLRWYKNDTINI